MVSTERLRAAGRLRGVAAPLGLAIAAAAGVAYVAAVDPNEPGHYPTSPFLWLTGLYCPGCGTLRAIHALAHFDLPAAVGFNVLTVAVIPFLVYWWVRWMVNAWRGRPRRVTLARPWTVYVFLAVVLAYWLLRNLPIGAFLAPGPA